MPFKLINKIRKCKYCNEKPRMNFSGKEKRNRGYYKTCGSNACLTVNYKDANVNSKKSYRNKNVKSICKYCKSIFIKSHKNQKFCNGCVVDDKTRARLYRYNIGKNWWDETFSKQNGLCAICKNTIPKCVDHDHLTGKVRGLLCNRCNLSLGFFENKELMNLCKNYLEVHSNSISV